MRNPVNPHGFDEFKLDAELRQRGIELFETHKSDTRKRVDTLARSIFVLSGGALTVSLGIFLRDAAPALTAAQALLLKWSWFGLFGGMSGFAIVLAMLIIQAELSTANWQSNLSGQKMRFGPKWFTSTTCFNWIVGSIAFLPFGVRQSSPRPPARWRP